MIAFILVCSQEFSTFSFWEELDERRVIKEDFANVSVSVCVCVCVGTMNILVLILENRHSSKEDIDF